MVYATQNQVWGFICLPAHLLPGGGVGGIFHSEIAIPYKEFPDAKKSIKGVMELPSYVKYFKRTKRKPHTSTQ